jgi:hypothetical protein
VNFLQLPLLDHKHFDSERERGMNSVVFETKRFRIHITGKAAWVETKDGTNWVFCNQHALPVSGDCGDSEILAAAVKDYEDTHGDQSLRAALTGAHPEAAVRPMAKPMLRLLSKAKIVPNKPAQGVSRPAGRAASSVPAKRKPSGYFGFRAPLRPPLLTPAVAALGPNAPNN